MTAQDLDDRTRRIVRRLIDEGYRPEDVADAAEVAWAAEMDLNGFRPLDGGGPRPWPPTLRRKVETFAREEMAASGRPMLDEVAAGSVADRRDDPKVESLVRLFERARRLNPYAPRITRAMLAAADVPKVEAATIASRLRAADVTMADLAGWISDGPGRHLRRPSGAPRKSPG